MYVVTIGMGQVGRHVLQTLENERHDVVAIDSDPEAIADIEEHHDVMTLLGYGGSSALLETAGAGKADLVVAVTNHDEANLIAALTAKQMGAKKVIARVQSDNWADCTSQSGVMYDYLGVDVVLNPRVLVAHEISKIARSHGATEVIEVATGVELVRMHVGDDAEAANKPLSKLAMPTGTLVAAVVRDGDVFVPGGADILRPGDGLYIIGKPARVELAEDMFSTHREARRVCVIGGGVVGKALTKSLLSSGVAVTIIEKNRNRAEDLVAELNGVTVIHGDGTDLELLKEEEIGSYDLVAAVSRDDESNLMACLLASRIGVDRTCALCHRPHYLQLYRQLGVDVTVSPRLVASDHVIRYCRGADIQSMAMIEEGKAEIVQVVAAEGSRAVGLPIRSQQLNFPRGALVGAILRGSDVIIPRGDDVIQPGDTVIVLATRTALGAVTRLFRKRAF